jgi:hypothetical protein
MVGRSRVASLVFFLLTSVAFSSDCYARVVREDGRRTVHLTDVDITVNSHLYHVSFDSSARFVVQENGNCRNLSCSLYCHAAASDAYITATADGPELEPLNPVAQHAIPVTYQVLGDNCNSFYNHHMQHLVEAVLGDAPRWRAQISTMIKNLPHSLRLAIAMGRLKRS